MAQGKFLAPQPFNEPVLEYAPGSLEREQVSRQLDELKSQEVEIPLIIGGKEVRTGKMGRVACPHDHSRVLARFHMAGPGEVKQAVEASQAAWCEWSGMSWQARAAVFIKAADLLSSPKYRFRINAATMLNQSKTVHQAEIDAACELADFFRFNAMFASRIYADQPMSAPGIWNYSEHRSLEGFVLAVTPFNFLAIAGNLPSAPALMGNTVIWKPASSVVFSNYQLMGLFKEAGLPDGVINFLPGSGGQVGNPLVDHPKLAGLHFTGSTSVFSSLWSRIGQNIKNYAAYPRIVGETGGKDFVVAHASADLEVLATALIRGAFEYQGQKCSAASRAYIPKSLWPRLKEMLADWAGGIAMGDVSDFKNFMGAVIDQAAFDKIKSYIDFANKSPDYKLVAGGQADSSKGWFVRPTIFEASDPTGKLMSEEIFGPVLTVYVYGDHEFEQTLKLADCTGPYALTGAVIAQDRGGIQRAQEALRYSAGNFYINDKPTGAVVGQQPFGGARASGTNDKAGSMVNLLRWTSQRSIKETFNPPTDYRYPFMG
jgi:1-pyrroline-5-carboxylate dehydrogenase